MKMTQISDGKNLHIELLDLGARIVGIKIGDTQTNLVCGYADIEDYANDAFYMGATIGPITNRIKNATLSVNNEPFQLPANEGATCLHSGGMGFDKEIWSLKSASDSHVEYKLVYDLNKVGMRGILTTLARYTAQDNALYIEYQSRCDTTTYINLTNHVYLNLSANQTAVHDHDFVFYTDKFVIKDEENASTNETQKVNSPFEYSLCDTSVFNGCVDQHFIVKDNAADTTLLSVAHAQSQSTGIAVEVLSNSPGFHFYTGHGLADPFVPFQGFCIETQTIPNAINLSEFEAPLLNANESRTQTTVLKFSTSI